MSRLWQSHRQHLTVLAYVVLSLCTVGLFCLAVDSSWFTAWSHLPAWNWTAIFCVGVIGSALYVQQTTAMWYSVLPALTVVTVRQLFFIHTPLDGQQWWLVVLWSIGCGWWVARRYQRQLLARVQWLALVTISWSIFAACFLHITNTTEFAVTWLVVSVAVAWSILCVTVTARTESMSVVTTDSKKWVWSLVILVIIALAAWNWWQALDHFAFQNDEYFHVNTAIGYNYTGDYIQWNTLTDSAGSTYTRAWPYTWQVAQSIKYFGQDEWTFRLPTFIWGILFLLVLAGYTYRVSRSPAVTALVVSVLAFDHTLTWAATYTRMYTMFWTLCILCYWWWWNAIAPRSSTDSDSWGNRISASMTQRWPSLSTSMIDGLRRTAWAVAALGLAKWSMVIQYEALLLIGGFGLSVVVCWRLWPETAWFRWAALIVVSGFIGALLLHLIHPFLPFDLMVIRQIPSSTYLSAPWSELLLGTIGLICCVCAWQLARHQAWIRRWLVLALSGSVPLVLYFTYAADRYAARKYAFFFIPLIIMMMAWAMLTVVRRVIGRSWADAVGYGVSVLLLVVVGIAGVGESWPWLQPVRADLTYVQAQAHDYPTAYQFVEQRAATGDALVTLSPEYYYLRRQDLSIIQIPPAKQWKKSDVLSLRQQYAHGWIIIPRWKGKQHVTASVRRVLKKQFTNAHSPTPTIDIYRW